MSTKRVLFIGIGKTLFLKKGFQQLIRDKKEHTDKYIFLGVDFKNIDQDKTIEYYKNIIYDTLEKNAIDNIRNLNDDYLSEFNKVYNKKYNGPIKTPNSQLYPVKFFCEYIYSVYDKPCIIVFDNIDLANVPTQNDIFKATVIVCDKLYQLMTDDNKTRHYLIYFAMRPETFKHREEGKIGKIIHFPLPNILKICIKIIKKILTDTAEEFDKIDKLKCEVEFYDIIKQERVSVKTFSDVAKYFIRIIEYYLGELWKNDDVISRLGTSEEFHCYILNYNVRTFLSFLSDTLGNGGFKPLTKEFNNSTNTGYYTIYNYIEMIIRGQWLVHPGNDLMDGEGGNGDPIVFNIFDSSLWDSTDNVKHFMLNIRILQYFALCTNPSVSYITYGKLKSVLGKFFDEECYPFPPASRQSLFAFHVLWNVNFLYLALVVTSF